MLMNNKASKD